MTDKYEPRVGDLLVYGSSVYRLVAVKDKKCADVRCEYVITAGGLVQKRRWRHLIRYSRIVF